MWICTNVHKKPHQHFAKGHAHAGLGLRAFLGAAKGGWAHLQQLCSGLQQCGCQSSYREQGLSGQHARQVFLRKSCTIRLRLIATCTHLCDLALNLTSNAAGLQIRTVPLIRREKLYKKISSMRLMPELIFGSIRASPLLSHARLTPPRFLMAGLQQLNRVQQGL